MFNRPRRPRPRWPPTRTKGVFLLILGGVFLMILFTVMLNVLFFSLGPILLTLWQHQADFDPLTDGVITSILLMTVGMVGPALLVMVAFGIGLLVWGQRTLRYDRQLCDVGQVTRAEIYDRWSRFGYRSSWHCVAYHFTAPLPDGRLCTYTLAERSYEAYRRLRVGDSAPLRYLPDNPRICRLELPTSRNA